MTESLHPTPTRLAPDFHFRILRAEAPTCYRLARLRRWRWDITVYRDGLHQIAHCGYTFTFVGATIAAGRAVLDEAAKT